MSSLMSSLGIDRLTLSERLQLVEEIWDSLVPVTEQLPLTEEQCQELDRRLAALKANPDSVMPWKQIEIRAPARFRK
jgi:putative addiction module component (TIGR02574 family)